MRGDHTGPVPGYVNGWGVVCGSLAAQEDRFRDLGFFLPLLALEEKEALVAHLQDTFIREYLIPGVQWEDFTRIAEKCFHDKAMAIRALCPVGIPVDIFLVPYDFMNLKVALRGGTTFPFPSGIFTEELLTSISKGDHDEMPNSLSLWTGWASSGLSQLSPLDLDILLDGACLRQLLAMAEAMGSAFIYKCVYEHVTALLVILFWRAYSHGLAPSRVRQLLQPLDGLSELVDDLSNQPTPQRWAVLIGGVLGDLIMAALEAPEEDQVMEFAMSVMETIAAHVAEGGIQTSGPEAVFSFMSRLEVQMRHLKIVVAGRLGGIDRDMLRRRLMKSHG
jgi:hypothetical protein